MRSEIDERNKELASKRETRKRSPGWRDSRSSWKKLSTGEKHEAHKLRVLHVHILPVTYGSGLNTFLSMKYLDKNRYDASLACAPEGPLEDMVRSHDFEFVPMKHFVREIHPEQDVKALFDLVKLLKSGNYDIVHTHNSKGGILGRLAARIANIPVVHTVHGYAFHDAESKFRQLLFREIEKKAAKWCDAMISISNPLIEWASREGVASASDFVRIPSGIEIRRFTTRVNREEVRKELGIKEDEISIVEVAKLWEGKGHDTLLRAFSKLGDIAAHSRLFFIGDGPLESSLRQLASELGLNDRVVFLGHRDDVDRILAAFDVAALPSEFEGMGRVILEAMARGLPVVATRVGGITDLVEEGVSGMLVNPRDVDGLANSLRRLIANEGLRDRLGIGGRTKVVEDKSGFDARVMAKRIQEVYDRVLQARGHDIGTFDQAQPGLEK